MYIGGSWGNSIYYANKEKTEIYGFKDRLYNSFSEGSVLFDLANNKDNDTIPLYYISNINYKDNCRDMFFADISLIGYVENPKPKGEYEINWFKGRLGKLRDEYLKEYEKTGFLKFKKRKLIKEFIKTLEGMDK